MGKAIGRFVLKRLGLAVLTLFLLSIVVFAGCMVLPGNVARAILGPFADQRAVDALNHQLGADRPALSLYWEWITKLLHGDMGTSYTFRAPVAPFVRDALVNSLKLAALAFVIVVPLSILGGIVAALFAGRWPDKLISLTSLSLTVIPEFVSSIALLLIFAIWLRWLPLSASFPADAGALTQIYYLLLPCLPLVIVLFGYFARMTRAGVVEAMASDYTRTAILKGLPRRTVIIRHVLRNALLPTITVIASQTSYLIGGLVVVEGLFRYQGIGSLILTAARGKDFPMLQGGILTIGALFIAAVLIADLIFLLVNPRTRTSLR
ncbi:peptide/nickel transport system permease protein [Arboricoccus pini]|uniref:Peptide/nickel transport system permease protein n=1 Tax=Arboricoccus pini TaxID=1963835 RepID=A0A212RSC3_9PROT|nr:ABC transporter permease [Arboricoccus pini]SNB75377.1 peptide/nickel transport system permease protein [Arboricoccus pini]